MKNQYFGDINDYRKYGLLRVIKNVSQLRLLVTWMLTPNDNRSDGKFIQYLKDEKKWEKHDPELFHGIKKLMNDNQERNLTLIENTNLIVNAEYFSTLVPDSAEERDTWFEALIDKAQSCDMIFLDPDNGLEIKSKGYGNKDSSKFLFWQEVEKLWSMKKSLVVYQHFIREKRDVFIPRMVNTLKEKAPESLVHPFTTSNVLFLMALQPNHQRFYDEIINSVQEKWGNEIKVQT